MMFILPLCFGCDEIKEKDLAFKHLLDEMRENEHRKFEYQEYGYLLTERLQEAKSTVFFGADQFQTIRTATTNSLRWYIKGDKYNLIVTPIIHSGEFMVVKEPRDAP